MLRGAKLEDRLRLEEILQAMRTEVKDIDLHKLTRRTRKKHLTAAPSCTYPGAFMDVQPDIPLSRQLRVASMQAHPHPDTT